MGSSIKVTGVGCDHGCVYCYEANMREATGNEYAYDLDAIMKAMEDRKGKDGSGAPVLHGGDPLMIPKPHVEALLAKMYELHGSSSVQTHGVTIDRDHVEMFKRYKTHVGISIDGPWPLNRLRVRGRDMSTREATNKTLTNLRMLAEEGVSVGIIAVLHRANVSKEHLPRFKEWLLELKSLGVNGGRLNLCIIDDPKLKEKWELDEYEAAYAYEELARFTVVENSGMYWQPFRDIVDNLLGQGLGTCIFHPCSYFQADAEKVIMGDGSLANCLKTAKSAQAYVREPDEAKDYARYNVLPQIPQEYGGCKGCRYWRVCYGVCPAEGIDGDWRNRSRFCRAYYRTYELIETYLKRILPNVQTVPDQPMVGGDWFEDYRARAGYGAKINPFEVMTPQGSRLPSSWKGSAWNARSNPPYRPTTQPQPASVQAGHGDRPHGDSHEHGDHTDARGIRS